MGRKILKLQEIQESFPELRKDLKDFTGMKFSDVDFDGEDLRGAIFRRSDFSGGSFERANLYNADLQQGKFFDANFREADLTLTRCRFSFFRDSAFCSANLHGADLAAVDLQRADLCGADLSDADLRGADLCGADLRGADFCGADLRGSCLYRADMSAMRTDDRTKGLAEICPAGEFVAWKKAVRYNAEKKHSEYCIIELLIPEDAMRSNGTGEKCRSSKAKVLGIYSIHGHHRLEVTEAWSIYDPRFRYKVGEIVIPDAYCQDRWKECANGINFFLDREKAIRYGT